MSLENEILEYNDRKIFIDLDSWELDGVNVKEIEHVFNNKQSLTELKKFLQCTDRNKLIDYVLFLVVMSMNLRESQRKSQYLLEPLLTGHKSYDN